MKKIARGRWSALELDAVEKDPTRLKPTVVFAPTAQEFEQWFATTKNHLILATLEHVQQRAYVYTLGSDGKWTRKRLPVPDNLTMDSVAASHTDDRFFLGVTGFLTPPSLWLGRCGRWIVRPGQVAEVAVRRERRCRGAIGGDLEGRDQGAVLCGASQGYAVERIESDIC